MLVRLIPLFNRTMHSIALLYLAFFCNKPHCGVTAGNYRPVRAMCSHMQTSSCRVSLVDFYRHIRIQHPTLTTPVPYQKVTDQTGCWGSLFLASAMYICKTCFRPCNSRAFMFIITCQNAQKYTISRH